jgi:hypothetical protein
MRAARCASGTGCASCGRSYTRAVALGMQLRAKARGCDDHVQQQQWQWQRSRSVRHSVCCEPFTPSACSALHGAKI